MIRISIITIALIFIFTADLTAQNQGKALNRPEYKQFNFWVGTWDVFNPEGKKVGENEIRKLDNGALLFENWISAGNTTGHSMNFFDPKRGKWRQIWVDDQGTIIDQEGEFRDGAMHFSGEHIYPDAENGHRTELFRMSFTPQQDGSVRQFIEQSKDAGKTWYVWFDGKYVRKK